jgi:diaminohydroxyphosphoribosylaminopyrimidine deaminase / 5-amino-6-(5-phosphoribosylamino)uracil reductase
MELQDQLSRSCAERKFFVHAVIYNKSVSKQNQTQLKSQGTQERIASGADRDPDVQAVDSWALVPELIRTETVPLPPHWDAIFGPLRGDAPDELFVVGQIGQSLDGCVATASGHSHYINGPAGLAHLHRLRAIVDAVVVGVGTALADDPQLTVRHVAGRNPARVVIDPGARLPAAAKMFARDGVRRLVMTAHDLKPQLPADIEIVGLQTFQRRIAPEAILSALHERGLRRILIEGGAETVSRFLVANCLDRLHVVVAPIIIGNGRPSFNLPPIERVQEALRAPMKIHQLDGDVLFDCDLSAERRAIGPAKTSMRPTRINDFSRDRASRRCVSGVAISGSD